LLNDLDWGKIRQIQRDVTSNIVLRDVYTKPIRSVGGIDLAFFDDTAVVACVILDYDSLDIRSEKWLLASLDFPYIPTLLCLREGPPLIEIINALESKPEIFLINAHGIAHPTRCGCASYVGVQANVPTIGIASRNLCGEYDSEPTRIGEHVPLTHNGRIVGWALKSQKGCRPIFISPGHCVSLASSLDTVLKCTEANKLPEPLSLAHALANRVKKTTLRKMR
jgi:deoxyribonuclease V